MEESVHKSRAFSISPCSLRPLAMATTASLLTLSDPAPPFEIERHIVQDVIPHVTVHPTVCSLYAAGGLRKWIACANLVPALVHEVFCIILCSAVLIVVVFTTVVK